ncbi:MAG: quinol:electron acceptor oxidoreductase subunit ActD, partial [Planctomycetota bacterium]
FEFPGAPWGLSGYEFLISAKPGTSSIPAFIPVTFETTILLSAFGAFFGMLILNQLPKLSNPLFRNERFASATTDGFFLFVDANDKKFAEAETEAYFQSIGATAVEGIDEEVTGHAVPGMIYLVGAAVGSLALLPPLYLWASSSTTTPFPRISIFKDMESQAKFKAQTTTALFEDGRAARPPVEGTVARGSGKDDMRLYYGVEPESNLANLFRRNDLTYVSADGGKVPARFASDDTPESEGESDPEELNTVEVPAEEPEPNWTKTFPESLDLDETFMNEGEKQYSIHCAACHGLAGNGDGLVSQRALALKQGAWVQPSSLHIQSVIEQPVGKIYNTITNGVRKMPGYKEHISPKNRWAIVLYIEALQRSQAATEDDLPAEKLRELSQLNK